MSTFEQCREYLQHNPIAELTAEQVRLLVKNTYDPHDVPWVRETAECSILANPVRYVGVHGGEHQILLGIYVSYPSDHFEIKRVTVTLNNNGQLIGKVYRRSISHGGGVHFATIDDLCNALKQPYIHHE